MQERGVHWAFPVHILPHRHRRKGRKILVPRLVHLDRAGPALQSRTAVDGRPVNIIGFATGVNQFAGVPSPGLAVDLRHGRIRHACPRHRQHSNLCSRVEHRRPVFLHRLQRHRFIVSTALFSLRPRCPHRRSSPRGSLFLSVFDLSLLLDEMSLVRQ